MTHPLDLPAEVYRDLAAEGFRETVDDEVEIERQERDTDERTPGGPPRD